MVDMPRRMEKSYSQKSVNNSKMSVGQQIESCN